MSKWWISGLWFDSSFCSEKNVCSSGFNFENKEFSVDWNVELFIGLLLIISFSNLISCVSNCEFSKPIQDFAFSSVSLLLFEIDVKS